MSQKSQPKQSHISPLAIKLLLAAVVTAAEKTPFFRRKQLPNLSHNLQIDYT